jgi:glycosyltransferase involved in cell wall biosynthesis
MKKLFVIANWMQGTGLSGGDRIFIELVKKWKLKLDITLFISQEGSVICRRHELDNIRQQIWASNRLVKLGYLIDTLYRTTVSIKKVFSIKMLSGDIIFSSSDFWPDFFPAFIMKLKNPKIIWIAGFYLFAPKPWRKDSPYRDKKFLTGLFYWLSQVPSYYVIRKFSDIVFVTSKPDVDQFITPSRSKEKVVVIRGGVDTEPAKTYLNSAEVIPPEERIYDACFIGRFHYQKGVLELCKIWQIVCSCIPKAHLVIIGSGPLENEIRNLITEYGLLKNIDLMGFLDGPKKFEVFKQSRIVVHPATFDSGGMAAAEAMSWGLPGVSFDLEALKTYYPKGMLKTSCFDIDEFANNILSLLSNHYQYKAMSLEALKLVHEEWEWNDRAKEIFTKIMVENPESKK